MICMPPTLRYIESFTVTGLNERTQNIDEFNEKSAKLPNLWQQFNASGLATAANIFAVYSDYESDANGLYTVTVGVTNQPKAAPFTSVNIQSGNYLVFQGEGPMPGTVVETWKQIWDYFAATNEHQRNFISDFESYSGPNKVAIYIGIKK